MNIVNVVLVVDMNYWKYALTTIISLLEKTQDTSRIVINIISCDVSEEEFSKNKNKITKIFPDSHIKLINYSMDKLKDVKPKRHVSKSAYLKILLPEIFSDIDEIIFLDSDLLFMDDILSLADNNILEDYSICAVYNPGYDYDNEVMGIPLTQKTFNSGVMIMNLKKMREENSVDKLLEFIATKNHLTTLNDQAAFNGVFSESWKELDIRWNAQYRFFLNHYKKLGIEKTEQAEVLSNPGIVHFTSESKPWMFRSAHPFKKVFLDTYKLIDEDLEFSDKSVKSLVQKLRERIRIIWSVITCR